MSYLTHFLIHPVTLTAPVMATNAYGDNLADWSQAPAAEYHELGWFTRVSTDETAEGREAITDTYELTLAPTSAITESMRVEHAGDLYEIRGSIDQAQAPDGTHHLVTRLRRVQG